MNFSDFYWSFELALGMKGMSLAYAMINFQKLYFPMLLIIFIPILHYARAFGNNKETVHYVQIKPACKFCIPRGDACHAVTPQDRH